MAYWYMDHGLTEYYYFKPIIDGAKRCIEQVNRDNHYSSMMAPECDRPISSYIYANFTSTRMILLGNYSMPTPKILQVEKVPK